MTTHLGRASDLPLWAVAFAAVLAASSVLWMLIELGTRESRHGVIAITGILANVAFLAAVVRPAWISTVESVVGARITILADTSRSLALADEDGRPRWETRDGVISKLRASDPESQFTVLGFDEGAPKPWVRGNAEGRRSDLTSALQSLTQSPGERPSAVIVVSDGRLDDPPENASDAELRGFGDILRVPVHTIATTRRDPPDASVRHVSFAGAVVAHVPTPIQVEVGCAGFRECGELPVTVRELSDDAPPRTLATGIADAQPGRATLDLSITMEHAGGHILEIAVGAPQGDFLAANDRRFLRVDVTRERVRVLHVAGRVTNDVRALRQWLKRDASLDVVAFFILRTRHDVSSVPSSQLSLIPFPVDELFQEHLSSFDAVVLQDFDAQPYGLERYFSDLGRYVRAGGGLVMVGGENAFVAGGYAGSPLADVLPVTLDMTHLTTSADPSDFTPEWTAQGLGAPILGPLRDAIGQAIPTMTGANILGDLRIGAISLWSHPERLTPKGAPMPVLAVGQSGEGRTIALGVDGTWRLQFSELGARSAGRGYGALWDGLLGWLMHEPRFELARLDLDRGCTAGYPTGAEARILAGVETTSSSLSLEIRSLNGGNSRGIVEVPHPTDSVAHVEIPPLDPGGYEGRLMAGSTLVAKNEFACEQGGDEWADSRPGPELLASLARVTGGTFSFVSDARKLSLPRAIRVNAKRVVQPILPPWALSLTAAALLGLHWVLRRRDVLL